MDKVKLDIRKGEAVIKEGGNSFIGKLMASANRVKVHKPGGRRDVAIVKAHPEVRSVEPTKARKAKK